MAADMLTETQKEQIKLRATFLNGVGIGVMLIGVFTPVTRLVYDTDAGIHIAWIAGPMFICFFLALTLHLLGARQLRELDKWILKS